MTTVVNNPGDASGGGMGFFLGMLLFLGSLFSVKTDPDRPGEDRQNVSFTYLVTPP